MRLEYIPVLTGLNIAACRILTLSCTDKPRRVFNRDLWLSAEGLLPLSRLLNAVSAAIKRDELLSLIVVSRPFIVWRLRWAFVKQLRVDVGPAEAWALSVLLRREHQWLVCITDLDLGDVWLQASLKYWFVLGHKPSIIVGAHSFG